MLDTKTLSKRATLVQAIRHFFVERGYLEVDTPVRLPAPVPEAHIEPETSGGWYLQTSPELCMKRLLAAGCAKLFQICKCFRKNERGAYHIPEFTMLEWYRSSCDYHGIMSECEELLLYLAGDFGVASSAEIKKRVQSLSSPWDRITVAEAFDLYAPISLKESLAAGKFDEILCQYIEPHLGRNRPLFLCDYPAPLGSLARLKREDQTIAERFELYIGGIEIANGFSELTDVKEQRERFEKDMATMKANGREPGPMPERFLADLAGMPEAAGIALGIDRLAMIFLGADAIDQVVAFPPEEL